LVVTDEALERTSLGRHFYPTGDELSETQASEAYSVSNEQPWHETSTFALASVTSDTSSTQQENFNRAEVPLSIQEIFAEMNIDNDDAVLTIDEVAQALKKESVRDYFVSHDFQLSGNNHKDAGIIMGALDKNGNKEISVLEFIGGMGGLTTAATRATSRPPQSPLLAVPPSPDCTEDEAEDEYINVGNALADEYITTQPAVSSEPVQSAQICEQTPISAVPTNATPRSNTSRSSQDSASKTNPVSTPYHLERMHALRRGSTPTLGSTLVSARDETPTPRIQALRRGSTPILGSMLQFAGDGTPMPRMQALRRDSTPALRNMLLFAGDETQKPRMQALRRGSTPALRSKLVSPGDESQTPLVTQPDAIQRVVSVGTRAELNPDTTSPSANIRRSPNLPSSHKAPQRKPSQTRLLFL